MFTPKTETAMLVWLQVVQKLEDVTSESNIEIGSKLHQGWKISVKLEDGREVEIPFDPDDLDALRAQVIALL